MTHPGPRLAPETRSPAAIDDALVDAASLAGRIGAAGAEVDLIIWPHMVHVFQVFPAEIMPGPGETSWVSVGSSSGI